MLTDLVPFAFLPRRNVTQLQPHISEETSAAGEIKFVQQKTPVHHLYVIAKGSAELYFEHDQKKTLRGMLSEGDCFGGISMLVNGGVAIRTMQLVEDTSFFLVPHDQFIGLCDEFEVFKEYFTNTFGKKMVDRAYADMVAGQIRADSGATPFLQQPITALIEPAILRCPATATIKQAATMMSEADTGYIFVHDGDEVIEGIVTDEDLRTRVIITGLSGDQPVATIMSSPLVSVEVGALVLEAYMAMIETSISHLAVRDMDGNIVGIVTDRQIITEQSRSPYFLIQEVKRAEHAKELTNIHRRLPDILLEPIKNGAQPETLTSLITTFSDAVLEKIVELALADAGPPPCTFAFLIMGSEGRREQTLKTDQDNAIIYQDIEDENDREEARSYFLALATTISTWLDEAGYSLCEGNNMASNPHWCQPLSVWKRYFMDWIRTPNPEDLLNSSIFFDFRHGYGDTALTDQLAHYLFTSLQNWPGFFRNMVENALYFKPPLGFFRNIVVQSKGEHKDKFDIKRALQPIIDFARIYGLKLGIRHTNTLERLRLIHEQRKLTTAEYDDIVQSYHYLMNMRFLRQITAINEEGGSADNFVNPKRLSRIDQTMLKEIFRRTEGIQQKMSIEMTGIV